MLSAKGLGKLGFKEGFLSCCPFAQAFQRNAQNDEQDAIFFILHGAVVELGPDGERLRYFVENQFFGMSPSPG